MVDGWYHVTARGIERRSIFADARDHAHFDELLEETVERFRIVLHAYVQMANHYHLLVQTPEANLSRAIQWLNVSHVAWFNRRHGRVGPLMQGRFKSIPVEDAGWAYELSLYVHLNPVMRRGLGLDKIGKRVEAQALRTPTADEVGRRLQELREYRWSSYRAYAGYAQAPKWLTRSEVLDRAAREPGKQIARYRADVQDRLTMGVDPVWKEQARDTFALGSEIFRERLRHLTRVGREIAEPSGLHRRMEWEDIKKAVAEVVGERSLLRRGTAGKPLLLWAARRYGGLTLRKAGEAVGGMDYTAVAMAVKRLEQRADGDCALKRLMQQVEAKCEM